MKKLLFVLTALSLLLLMPLSACAEAAPTSAPADATLHLLWDIPYGTDANTFIGLATQNAGLTLIASATAEDGTVTALGLAPDAAATYLNQPLKSVQIDLSPAAQAPDGKGYGAAYLEFAPPAAQGADEAAAYIAALYGAARASFGNPTNAGLSCVFGDSADYGMFDAPLNNSEFDAPTLAMAMSENMMVSITFYFNNVQLIAEYSKSFTYVGLNFYTQAAVVPAEHTRGYYKGVGETAAPDTTDSTGN